jgi:hypothetical protein
MFVTIEPDAEPRLRLKAEIGLQLRQALINGRRFTFRYDPHCVGIAHPVSRMENR